MLGTLRLKVEEKAEAELRKRAYCLSMADLPLYAVQAACTAALRAAVGDTTGKWAPQPGELHKAAEVHMALLIREKADITRILKAAIREDPVTTSEDRKAAVARILAKTRSATSPLPPNEEHLSRMGRAKGDWPIAEPARDMRTEDGRRQAATGGACRISSRHAYASGERRAASNNATVICESGNTRLNRAFGLNEP